MTVESADFRIRFPELLRRSRQDAHLSIRELARRAGIDPTHLSRMERGHINLKEQGLQAGQCSAKTCFKCLWVRGNPNVTLRISAGAILGHTTPRKRGAAAEEN